jgi:hypothetical protein
MNYKNSHFKKLLTESNNRLVAAIMLCVTLLAPVKYNNYKRHVKYSLKDYAIGIIDVLKNNSSWNSYCGIINGNTLRKKHNEWTKMGVYDKLYKESVDKYLKNFGKTKELKLQSIDSTFVEKKGNSKFATKCGVYKCKKGQSSTGIKITSIVTTNGIPISVNIDAANNYDSKLLPAAINNCIIDCNTKKYKNHNRYKQTMLADAGYDSKMNYKILKKRGYKTIILQNKRSIKNENLLRILNKHDLKKYKKRIIVENYHSWIKKLCKIKYLYETNIENYKGLLLLLGISMIIYRRIVNT